jgi:nitrate reductase gamma subunit
MTIFLYGVIYSSLVVFLSACAIRAARYARAPVHLRWELYPVPHEEPDRVKHGGSYFEASDWWTKSVRFNLWGELKFMIPEMLFLKGLWEFNRKMWSRSFPFHFGLYLLIVATVTLFLRAAAGLISPGLDMGLVGQSLHFFCTWTGLAGAGLALWGASGLLLRRLTDEGLKTYTTRGDILNLLFFIVTLGLLIAAYAFRGAGAPSPFDLARGILTFQTGLAVPALQMAALLSGAMLLAYIPLTHMSHFIAKWFTYHSVRWDDAPSGKREALRVRFAEYLTYRPTWSAPHMGADGLKTWADVVVADPTKGVRK